MKNDQKFLIAVLGPTAIGKTTRAIEIAQAFSTEIISCDSRQFFNEMRIGTAVPDAEELAAVPHHFIGHLSVEQAYSVGDYEKDALQKLDQLFKHHQCAVMVGGSGLYAKAVVEGLDTFPEVDPQVRAYWRNAYETSGIEILQQTLLACDASYAAVADMQNPQRLLRAIEVTKSSGRPYSSFRTQHLASRNFETIAIGLESPREIMYERINRRVDQMMADGLYAEAKSLYAKRGLNALQTVGYKELFAHFDDEISVERAVELIKQNTRRYAKRQMTWFRKMPGIQWFSYDAPKAEILDFIRLKTKTT